MPIPGFLAGLEEGLATEIAQQRQAQRAREDKEFTQNLTLLDQLRQDPRTTPEMYQKVLQDTLQTQKGLASQRKPKKGIAGLMGQTDTTPYHSQILDQLASGDIPLFQDKQAFDVARSGTKEDLHNAVVSGLQGGAQGAPGPQSGPAGSVPPPPTPQPPQQPPAQAGGGGPVSSQVNSATPPMSGAPAPQGEPSAPGGAPGGAPATPPGPIPSPPGTGDMLSAATGLSTQVQQTGPVLPQQRQGPVNLPQPPSAADILARHRQNPSAFFNTDELAQLQASASTQNIPYQAKAEYESLVAAGVDPHMASLAVTRKLTGFTGGITSQEGPQYVDESDGSLLKSVIQKDNYGNFVETDPRSGLPIDRSKMQLYVPSDYQAFTDKGGNVRFVRKSGAITTGGPGAPSAPGAPGAPGQRVAGGGPAPGTTVGPNLGPIGKPQIPPPAFSGNATVFGDQGQPQLMGIPRSGGPLVPLQVPNNASVPPPPRPGQQPTHPAEKFQMARPLSAQAETSLTSVNVVKQAGDRALQLIDQLKGQGYSDSQPISQEIYFRIYQMGWPNSNELEDQLQQLLGVDQVNGLKNYMGGRPNQRLMEIVQAHLPEPGDSLELSRRKLVELKEVTDMVEKAIVQAGSQYRQQPFPVPGGAGGPSVPNAPPPNPFRNRQK